MENPLENILAYLFSFGLLGLLVLFLVVLFVIWIIKKGVKQAIMEVLDDDEIFKDIEVSVAQGVLMALEQYNNGNEKNERPSE